MDSLRTYHVQNPFQALGDHPAVNIVIGKSGTQIKSGHTTYEQQKLASQQPRGTRLDATGTRIQVKGARNYTSRNLYISREEMYDDVVSRGLRADGLSTKLGVKNHKDGIGKGWCEREVRVLRVNLRNLEVHVHKRSLLISELFEGDSRLPVVEEHFKTQRQKSNSAKTMFSTMAHEELQFLKQETFPSRIDVQVRDYLLNAFVEHPEKLQAAVEVLRQIQQIFKAVTPHADFLSNHNFQTRGFFLDIILMTCSFLMQIIQDSDQVETVTAEKQQRDEVYDEQQFSEENLIKENKRAAEILLSVGSDIVEKTRDSPSRKTHATKFDKVGTTAKPAPTTIVVEGSGTSYKANDEWTTVEMVDASGNARYVLIKADGEDGGSMNTAKILNVLQGQSVTWDDKIEVSFDNNNISQVPGVADQKENMENDSILEQVLRDAGGDNLNLKINVRGPSNSTGSDVSKAGTSSENYISEQGDAIMTQHDQSLHENTEQLLAAIGKDLSKSHSTLKRSDCDPFSGTSKKLKIDDLEPT